MGCLPAEGAYLHAFQASRFSMLAGISPLRACRMLRGKRNPVFRAVSRRQDPLLCTARGSRWGAPSAGWLGEAALPRRHPGKRRRSDGRLKPRSGPLRERSLLAMLTRKADGSIFAIPGPGLNHPQLQSLVPKRGNRDVFRDERIRTLQKGAGQIRFGDKNLPVSGKECPDLRVCGRREAPDDDEIHGRVLTGSSCPGPYTCPPAPPPGPFRFPRRAAPAATPAGCRRR